MMKAKLIKRSDVAEQERSRKSKPPQKAKVQRRINILVDWIEKQHSNREDPRKAFAALFAQPQAQ